MSEMTRIDGTINHIGDTQEVGQKGFKKRELWLCLDADAERPQFICLEATFEMIDVLDGFSVGDAVVAHYALGGRIWEGGAAPRCFNSLSLKKLQTLADRDEYENEAKSENTENTEETEKNLGDEMPF
jgi:hypothetical protein